VFSSKFAFGLFHKIEKKSKTGFALTYIHSNIFCGEILISIYYFPLKKSANQSKIKYVVKWPAVTLYFSRFL